MTVIKKDIKQALDKAKARKAEARAELRRAIEDKDYYRSVHWFDQLQLRAETYWDLYLEYYRAS